MLLTGLTCACELSEGFLPRFAEPSTARRSWRMHSEPLRTATGLCCSLLGNAGRALARGGTGGRAGCTSMLWFGLRTQTLRAACPEAETWVQSPPHRCSQKRVHNKGCWCRSRLGASQQPQPTPLPLASQPALPHAGASFLHVFSVALTLALLSACNAVTFSKLLWMEGRAITPTIHVRNRHAGQPRDPPRPDSTWMSRDVSPRTPASSSQPVFLIIAPCHKAALCSPDLRKALTTSGCNCAKPESLRATACREAQGHVLGYRLGCGITVAGELTAPASNLSLGESPSPDSSSSVKEGNKFPSLVLTGALCPFKQ